MYVYKGVLIVLLGVHFVDCYHLGQFAKNKYDELETLSDKRSQYTTMDKSYLQSLDKRLFWKKYKCPSLGLKNTLYKA